MGNKQETLTTKCYLLVAVILSIFAVLFWIIPPTNPVVTPEGSLLHGIYTLFFVLIKLATGISFIAAIAWWLLFLMKLASRDNDAD